MDETSQAQSVRSGKYRISDLGPSMARRLDNVDQEELFALASISYHEQRSRMV